MWGAYDHVGGGKDVHVCVCVWGGGHACEWSDVHACRRWGGMCVVGGPSMHVGGMGRACG